MSVNFHFARVHHLLTELNVLIHTSHNNKEYFGKLGIGYNRHQAVNHPKHIEVLADCTAGAKELSEIAEQLFSALGSSHINNAIQRLRRWPENSQPEWSELNLRARALRDAIEIELQGRLYYQYPKEKGDKLRRWKDDWQTVLVAFPGLQFEAHAATDCYALGHYTASVFHSMRIAEIGLRAIAKERSVALRKSKPLDWATWQEVISAVEGQKRIIADKPPGAAKDAALEFYSGALAELNGFKDEFRNLVMHVRASYDEPNALRALTGVHHFMKRIANKIDHTHQAINWGL